MRLNPAILRWLQHLALPLLLLLTFWVRTYNHEDIFHDDGRVYFVEGDCYSRMTRAKMVTEGHWVIRHHDFENWPQGTTPHTTAPLDWLIAAGKGVCWAGAGIYDWMRGTSWRSQALDVSGALISPLLAVITAAWLWWWAGWMRLPYRGAMVFFFAVSPVVVFGTVLGRPDHQALLIPLLAVAVGAELALADLRTGARLARRWALTAGLAWGLALWVSLYEPLIFFAGAIAWHLMASRPALFARAVWVRWIALGAMLLVALLIDGWRLTWPDETLRQYFSTWSHEISELRSLTTNSFLLWSRLNPDEVLAEYQMGTVWKWMGALWLTAPVLLWLAGRRDPRARGLLPLIIAMLALTAWQIRWGYFVVLAVAVSLPWQLAAFKSRWLGWTVACVAMFPLLWGWAELRSNMKKRERIDEQRAVQEVFRNLVEDMMRSPERQPFLAAWWQSPQIAYWSGQPGVAGTSHQSLAGIVDSARFFTAETPEAGAAILRNRGVRWVFIDDQPRTDSATNRYPAVDNGARILGLKTMIPEPLGWKLSENHRYAPPYLRFVTPEERGLVYKMMKKTGEEREEPGGRPVHFYLGQFFKLYEVLPDKL